MPDPHWKLGETLVQVSHLAGEEFYIGAADTDPFDIDEDLTRQCDGRGEVLNFELLRSGDHEGPQDSHQLFVPSAIIGVR